MYKEIFEQPYYQVHVGNSALRWQHYIAWAKERAKSKGLLKRPEESGRGIWELSEDGLRFCVDDA